MANSKKKLLNDPVNARQRQHYQEHKAEILAYQKRRHMQAKAPKKNIRFHQEDENDGGHVHEATMQVVPRAKRGPYKAKKKVAKKGVKKGKKLQTSKPNAIVEEMVNAARSGTVFRIMDAPPPMGRYPMEDKVHAEMVAAAEALLSIEPRKRTLLLSKPDLRTQWAYYVKHEHPKNAFSSRISKDKKVVYIWREK